MLFLRKDQCFYDASEEAQALPSALPQLPSSADLSHGVLYPAGQGYNLYLSHSYTVSIQSLNFPPPCSLGYGCFTNHVLGILGDFSLNPKWSWMFYSSFTSCLMLSCNEICINAVNSWKFGERALQLRGWHGVFMPVLCTWFCAGEYGFLGEQRRTNVAITRARRHLALIGDSETVCNEPFLKGLIDHCHRCGEVWSADEFLQGNPYLIRSECYIWYNYRDVCINTVKPLQISSMLNTTFISAHQLFLLSLYAKYTLGF